jgi:hypothetical protein
MKTIVIRIPLTDSELSMQDKQVLGDIVTALAFQFEYRVDNIKIDLLPIKN